MAVSLSHMIYMSNIIFQPLERKELRTPKEARDCFLGTHTCFCVDLHLGSRNHHISWEIVSPQETYSLPINDHFLQSQNNLGHFDMNQAENERGKNTSWRHWKDINFRISCSKVSLVKWTWLSCDPYGRNGRGSIHVHWESLVSYSRSIFLFWLSGYFSMSWKSIHSQSKSVCGNKNSFGLDNRSSTISFFCFQCIRTLNNNPRFKPSTWTTVYPTTTTL